MKKTITINYENLHTKLVILTWYIIYRVYLCNKKKTRIKCILQSKGLLIEPDVIKKRNQIMSISKDIGYLKDYACLFLSPKKLVTIIGRQDEK